METLRDGQRITSFESQFLRFTGTDLVDEQGVRCDSYDFIGDDGKDLGVIIIARGVSTPLQKVNIADKGANTIEGHMAGSGRLIIKRNDGTMELYEVGGRSKVPLKVEVKKGDVMQWQASKGCELNASEECTPKYKPGRYTNL